ncbi:MAG: polyamine aminopropyltransferase [Zestosphaera sp.]
MCGLSEVGLGLVLMQGIAPNTVMLTNVKKVILTARTKYQEVQIAEFQDFGRGLVLDGYIQSTEADEHIYHESLVQPAMTTHTNPRKALIIGGGEGATLRETLKHSTVEEAVMVDIDGELVDFAKKYLDFMHKGAFDDPRSKVVIEDGLKYVEEAPKRYFDVVINDLTDPYGPEVGRKLYSTDYYVKVKEAMSDDGILVTQAGNSFFFPTTYRDAVNSLKSVFSIVREYWVWIPSFGYACNYLIASDVHDPLELSAEQVDEILRLRGVVNKYYDGLQHVAMMRSKVIVGRDFTR